jgi:hypothetical protein
MLFEEPASTHRIKSEGMLFRIMLYPKRKRRSGCCAEFLSQSENNQSEATNPLTSPDPAGVIGSPPSAYSLSLFRSVRIEIPKILAA